MDETKRFRFCGEQEASPGRVFHRVYKTLEEDGNYDAMTQMVGYLLTGELAYIPRKSGARSEISQIEREELLEELTRFYLRNIHQSTNLPPTKLQDLGDDCGFKKE